jgi:hypothetical protein
MEQNPCKGGSRLPGQEIPRPFWNRQKLYSGHKGTLQDRILRCLNPDKNYTISMYMQYMTYINIILLHP